MLGKPLFSSKSPCDYSEISAKITLILERVKILGSDLVDFALCVREVRPCLCVPRFRLPLDRVEE